MTKATLVIPPVLVARIGLAAPRADAAPEGQMMHRRLGALRGAEAQGEVTMLHFIVAHAKVPIL
jgi:hypothetical protein